MPPQTADELFREALALESRAAEAGEENPDASAMRKHAAELRKQAFGPKVYPVLVCSSCSRITGWTGTDGRCESCLRSAQLDAAYSDPHGGSTSPTRALRPRTPPLRRRSSRGSGRSSAAARRSTARSSPRG
jgi:hypothetical protein